MSASDTIFALSSAPGRAGIAVIRVSGAAAQDCLTTLAGALPPVRKATLRTLKAPHTGNAIDSALVLWFQGPKSFTGEDVAEFHVHGGRAVVQALLEALGALPACRMAEPGEFARRAFENGKLDLTAAEGLADLIDAETEAQRVQAVRQADGALARLYGRWRSDLVAALALQESAIDFSDEQDVAIGVSKRAANAARALHAAISAHLRDANRGEILRGGFRITLAGPPNAGKSSLLNALARRDVAIVAEEAGTTRDVIEVRLDIDGLPIVISDTAGLREAQGPVEREGIRRTLAQAGAGDLVIWLIDACDPVPGPPAALLQANSAILPVVNKVDLVPDTPPAVVHNSGLRISALHGHGLSDLTARLGRIARSDIGDGEGPAPTRARHREQLQHCQAALAAYQAGDPDDIELRAEDLRRAASALGRIIGKVDVEDILDQIFASFCIGK